jgi:hypothetical protein
MTTIDIPDYLRRTKDNKMPEISKPLVYSFTMLNTADTCLHRCYRQYVKRDVPYVETPEMKWGNEVHSAMEYRVGGKPLPEKMRHWEPIAATFARPGARSEMKMGVTRDAKPAEFFGKDVFLRGKIDVTLIEGTSAFLPDWKTGNSRYEDPFELEIQALMLKIANPYLTKIGGCYVWLKENRIGKPYDLTDVNSTWAKVHNKVEVIEDAMKAGEWPKTKGPLCGFCGVKDCENWFEARPK